MRAPTAMPRFPPFFAVPRGRRVAFLSNRFLAGAKVLNCTAMNPHIQRADVPPHTAEPAPATDFGSADETLDLGLDDQIWSDSHDEPRAHGADGRAVLGTGLTILAAIW